MKRKFTFSFSTHNVTDIDVELDVPDHATEKEIRRMVQRGDIDWLEEINQQHTALDILEATKCEHRELLSFEEVVDAAALRKTIREMAVFLHKQETRLHAIEEAVDGWSTEEAGDNKEYPLLEDSLGVRLQKVQEACPWDDDNEHDSWYFHEKKPK